jgi:DNA-binding transcriptional ArsR family regulator
MSDLSSKDPFWTQDPTLKELGLIEQTSTPTAEEVDKRYKELLLKPLLSGQDLLDLPYRPNDYLVENFIWRNDIAIMIAKEKVGKTIFSSQMAMSLTSGEPFLGAFDVARPLNILYMQCEGTLYQTQDNLRKAFKEGGIKWDKDKWRHLFCPAIALDTNQGFEYVRDRINASQFIPDIIFIDPLYMALSGSLNKDEPARAFCGNIRKLQELYSCSIIILHHEHRSKVDTFGGKIEEGDDAIHGSFVWKAFPSHVIRLTWNKRTNVREVTCSTSRNGKVVKNLKTVLRENPLMFEIQDTDTNRPKTVREAVLSALNTQQQVCTADMLVDGLYEAGTISNIFSSLKKQGFITESGREGRNIYYSLTKKPLKLTNKTKAKGQSNGNQD